MPYSVRDARLLEGLAAGDEITADVVVDNNGAYLDHIVVAKGALAARHREDSNEPHRSEKRPDLANWVRNPEKGGEDYSG